MSKCYFCGRGVNANNSHCMVIVDTQDGDGTFLAHLTCVAKETPPDAVKRIAQRTFKKGKGLKSTIIYTNEPTPTNSTDAPDALPMEQEVDRLPEPTEEPTPTPTPTNSASKPPSKHGW